jgi:hypothetical protein
MGATSFTGTSDDFNPNGYRSKSREKRSVYAAKCSNRLLYANFNLSPIRTTTTVDRFVVAKRVWFLMILGCGESTESRCLRIASEESFLWAAESRVNLWQTLSQQGQPALDSLQIALDWQDSIPTIRPSDSLWYREHCWDGKPR